MAVAHDKDWTSTATGTITLTTPTGGVAAGNTVLLAINNRNGLPSAVTDSIGGNTWTLLESGSTQSFVAVYGSVLANTLTAGSTITVTLGSGFGEAVATSFSGVGSLTRDDHANASDTTQTTHNVTTAAGGATTVGDLVFGAFGAKATVTFAAGTGYTLGGTVSNSTSTAGSVWKTATATGNQTATATSGSVSVAMAVVILPAAGGGGTTFTDSGTGTLTFTGSAAESTAHTSSASGSITFSGSASQTHAHIGAASGTIAFTGASSESQAHTSASSGAISFTGSASESNSAVAVDATVFGNLLLFLRLRGGSE